MATEIGVRAKMSAASRATFSPAHSRTVRCSRNTASTPSTTWGSSTDQLWKPKIATEIACGHIDIGGLSVETRP